MPSATSSSASSSRMVARDQDRMPPIASGMDSLTGAPLPTDYFDRLTDLARRHFNAPVALITLNETSEHPGSLGQGPHATHRDLAFCAQAVRRTSGASDDLVVIEDVAEDLVLSFFPSDKEEDPIRFYAGAPIVGSHGRLLGTLCLLDHHPRRLDEAGKGFLSDLAIHARDLMELHLANVALAQAATRDPLTGLANRSTFESELERAMESAFAGRPFALLYIDVDGFKPLNERHGHDVGDDVLRQIGRRLSSSIRASDFPARIGGDEFAIILTEPATHEIATRVARRLISDLAAPIMCNGVELSMTASVGCALALRHGTTAAELRRAADEALYMAKRSGRGQLAIADEVVSSLGDASYSSIEQNLATAIQNHDLKLQWQPYFRTGDGMLTGYEALVRWTCPGVGPVPPSTFIPVAEASGLIGALDEWVLRRACTDAAAMPDELTVSVNLSAYWFSRGELVRLVRSVLHETGLSPHRLILELTERTIITHTESARQSMDFLRNLGVCFALDDFGTSYSSLNYLRQLPFDTIKLDRSFVTGLGSDPQAEAVAGAIIHLGHALGMKVCAEGVETSRQMTYLTDGQCDLAQGYLLGRPEWEPLHLSGVRHSGVH